MRSIILLIASWLLVSISTSHAQTPLLPRDVSIKGPQTFAIIMGVSKYKYVRPLAYADKDAQLFKDYLRSPGGGSVKEQNIYILLNDNASNSNFWGKGFQWLKAKNLQRGDRLFIYLAGHGDAIDEDQFFFLSYDCNPEGDKNNYLVAGAIQLFNLKKKIANETTKGVEVIFIMDACRSNELPGGIAGQNFLNTAVSEKKAGEIIMLATGAGQESLEDASIGTGQGLFTYYLVDGLNGVADSLGGADRKVTFSEIQAYVNKNVPSIAEQRFKRKQDPYFCCSENGDKIISTVDTAYLQKWLKTKKSQNRSGKNAVLFKLTNESPEEITVHPAADTALVETYNAFYKAISAKRYTGTASAEDYFSQLNKKYPGNPYTLDAKSTLAVEYIDIAQAKVDRYLRCGDEGTQKEKQENYQAAINLEKAIRSVSEDDEDFARSLWNRYYLLKASGDYGPGSPNGDINEAFRNAYAALALEPNGAYIQNKLAQLHLDAKRPDSALYYAKKATLIAPNWRCAFITLSRAQNSSPNDPTKKTVPKPGTPKSGIGFTAGGGLSQANPVYSGNRNSGFTNVNGTTAASFDVGITYQVGLGRSVSIRPAVTAVMSNSSLDFERSSGTGGPVIIESIAVKTVATEINLPVIIRLSSKPIAPYIDLGPSFTYILHQDNNSREKVPARKTAFSGTAGLGVDLPLGKSRFILSPELKFSRGLTDMKDAATQTSYTLALTSFKSNTFSFNLYFRKR